jgi:transposase
VWFVLFSPTEHYALASMMPLGTIFQDVDFVSLFPPDGQPAESPVRLALATILQFVEGLLDRAAADAVRSRIDWKYLLCLELTDPGFDHTVLSEFRSRLLKADAEHLLFDAFLVKLREKEYSKPVADNGLTRHMYSARFEP